MHTKEIEDRGDVDLLVRTFYKKIRQDALLGPIFNDLITHWEEHLEHLTDFWEAQLFLKRKYTGNPVAAHIRVDAHMQGTMTPAHFGHWLQLWFSTIDELFVGETAWIAKNRAQKMSTMLYLKVFEERQSS